MTDDLVKRLRADDADNGMAMGLSGEAADRIEAQAAEIERLRALLVRGYVVCDGDDDDAVAFRTDAHAALGDTQ